MPFSFGIGMHDVKCMYINKRSKIKYEHTATTKNYGKDKPALCRRKESWCVCVCESFSRAPLFDTPWTVAHQAPTSTGFSRQEYWNGLPFPSQGDFPNTGIKPESPTLQADSTV